MSPEDVIPAPQDDSDDPAAPAAPTEASFSAMRVVEAQTLSANGCAIASANADTIEAMGSAIGMARAEGGFISRFSVTPLAWVNGDATVSQSYASALIAGDSVEIHQSFAPLVAGRTVHAESFGAAAVVASEARVERGAIGVLLAGRTELSGDTRVLVGTRAALIIAVALLGGFGLLAVAGIVGVRRLATWRPLDVEALGDLLPWRHHDQ